MSRRRQVALLATSTLTVAASLAACGNPITANYNWRSLSALVTVTEHAGSHNLSAVVLAGPLVDAQGRPVPRTAFTETCTQIGPIGYPAPAYRCLAVVYTGPKVYFAGGTAAGPYGKLQSLATPATLGSITITNLSGTQAADKPVLIEISAAKGLNGNNIRLSAR